MGFHWQGVIAEVASFLDPPAVVSYGMTCKAAEDVFWQVCLVVDREKERMTVRLFEAPSVERAKTERL